MPKLRMICRLKTWGKDYPTDTEGNVVLGPPTAYYATLYVLGAEKEQDGKWVDYQIKADPNCKSCVPQVQMTFSGTELSLLENATIFGPGTLTFEFTDETPEVPPHSPVASPQSTP